MVPGNSYHRCYKRKIEIFKYTRTSKGARHIFYYNWPYGDCIHEFYGNKIINMTILALHFFVILASILVFLFVITFLVIMLLYARAKLTQQGEVTLKINDKEIRVQPGSSVLSTLSNQAIYLPSACGGGGTCGLCKCQIIEGGGAILPTETGFFTRKEQRDRWRLGCQVKIREPLKVDVPRYETSFKDFVIEEEYRCDWDRYNMWDFSIKNTTETFRAYSMANYPAAKDFIKLKT